MLWRNYMNPSGTKFVPCRNLTQCLNMSRFITLYKLIALRSIIKIIKGFLEFLRCKVCFGLAWQKVGLPSFIAYPNLLSFKKY